MSKLSARMFEEVTEIVERMLNDFVNVNKYDVFTSARSRTGEYVRYRDVREEIDSIIKDVADNLNIELEKKFVRRPDGTVYIEYVPEGRRDSGILESESDEQHVEEAEDENEDESEDEDAFYTTISSQGRIYIPSDIRKKFDIKYVHVGVTRDPDNTRIILSKQGAFADGSLINLYYYSQIYAAKTLNLDEGDKVKIYKSTNDKVVIEPA